MVRVRVFNKAVCTWLMSTIDKCEMDIHKHIHHKYIQREFLNTSPAEPILLNKAFNARVLSKKNWDVNRQLKWRYRYCIRTDSTTFVQIWQKFYVIINGCFSALKGAYPLMVEHLIMTFFCFLKVLMWKQIVYNLSNSMK